MAEVIRMPKMSDTMEEGVIAAWLKKVGDQVKAGDILAEVETDKATMELEAYEDGTLLHIGIKVGEAAPVDGIIAVIGKKGEAFDQLLTESDSSIKDEVIEETKEEEMLAEPVEAKEVPKEEVEEKIDTSAIKAAVINMPKMSGFDVLKKVRDVPTKEKWQPVIIISARQELESMEQSYALEADHYITKPCEVSDILKAIRLMASLIPQQNKLSDSSLDS